MFSIRISSQNILLCLPMTSDSRKCNQYEMFCAGPKYITHHTLAAPILLSLGRQISDLLILEMRCPSDLISSACCNN